MPNSSMTTRSLLLVPLLALATACGGPGSASEPAPPGGTEYATALTDVPSDTRIAALVYDDRYAVPDGFFIDERSETTRSYTVHQQ